MDSNKDYDHLFKIVMLGDDHTGKTSLLTRYIDDTFSQEYNPSVKSNKIKKHSIKLIIQFSIQNKKHRKNAISN